MTRKEKKKKKKQEELRNTPEEDPEFQIAPMIDILLVLLVFFMSISSTEVLQNVGSIELPVAEDADEPGEDISQVIINIEWLPGEIGRIIVSEQQYANAEALKPMLARNLDKVPNTRVLIRADQDVRYEFMRSVMKSVAEVGIGNVTFSTVNKEQDAPGPG